MCTIADDSSKKPKDVYRWKPPQPRAVLSVGIRSQPAPFVATPLPFSRSSSAEFIRTGIRELLPFPAGQQDHSMRVIGWK